MALTHRLNVKRLNESLPQRIAQRNEGRVDVVVATLEHLAGLSREIDSIREKVVAMTKPQLASLYENVKRDQQKHWVDYTLIRETITPVSERDRHYIKWMAWILFVRFTLLTQQISEAMNQAVFEPWPALLTRNSESFAFVKTVTATKNIIVSHAPIGSYSPRMLMLAFTAVVDALDQFGWSPSAHEYFMALYWRYALLLDSPADYGIGDGGPFRARTPDECSKFLSPAPLTDAFIEVSERLVFHHYFRLRALRTLVPLEKLKLGANLSAMQRWAHWRKTVGVDSFKNALKGLQTHPMLQEEISDRIIVNTAGRFVYPGEHEQMHFTYPDEASESGSGTLFRLRLDVYQRLSKLAAEDAHKFVLSYLIATVESNDASKTLPSSGDATFAGVFEEHLFQRDWEHERLVQLIFEVCFDVDCTSSNFPPPFVGHSYVDDRTFPAPGDRPPSSVRAACSVMVKTDHFPLFLSIWNCYMIVRRAGPDAESVVLITPHLLDALATWIAFAAKDGHLKLDSLRGGWAACIAGLPLGNPDACLFL